MKNNDRKVQIYFCNGYRPKNEKYGEYTFTKKILQILVTVKKIFQKKGKCPVFLNPVIKKTFFVKNGLEK